MKRFLVTGLSLFLLFSAVAASAQPNGRIVFLGDGDVDNPIDQIAGRGVPLPKASSSRGAFDAHGNEVVWREVRRNVDPRGGTHVFYRQYLLGNGAEAELLGSEIGLHYQKDGVLTLIGGRQYRSIIVANRPTIDAEEALGAAERALKARTNVLDDIARAKRAHSLGRTKLELTQVGNVFRYAWVTYADAEDGEPMQVYLDAQSEQIIGSAPTSMSSNCDPTTPWVTVSATGRPSIQRCARVASSAR